MGDWRSIFSRMNPWQQAIEPNHDPLPNTLTPEQKRYQDIAPLKGVRPYLEDFVDMFQYGTGMKDSLIGDDPRGGMGAKLGTAINYLDPLSKISTLKAIGVIPFMARKANRVANLTRLGKEAKALEEGLHPASLGFKAGFDDLMKSHPRVMSELDTVHAGDSPYYAAYGDWKKTQAGYTGAPQIKDYNKEVQHYNDIVRGMYPDKQLPYLGVGDMSVNPQRYSKQFGDSEAAVPMMFQRAKESAIHETTHHAQNLMSDTPNRQSRLFNVEKMMQAYPNIGYVMRPKEIGARATTAWKTSGAKAARGKKSYVDAVVDEINNSLAYSYPTWGKVAQPMFHYQDELSKWAKEALPIMSEQYGFNLIPMVQDGKFIGVTKGSALPSRILRGQPIGLDSARKLRDVNINNYRTGTMKRLADEPLSKEPQHLEDLMKFIRQGKRPVAVVSPSQSDNFIGNFGHSGSINVFPTGAADPGMIGHEPVLGAGSGRFRYKDGHVMWTDPPSADEFFAVEDYLAGLGKPVSGHRDMFSGQVIRPPKPTPDEW